jgi:DNA-binding transcriptional LysR family regulator
MVAVTIRSDMRFLAVAAPAYVSRFGQPDVPDDLRNHRCIRQRLPSGTRYRWEFERQGQQIAIDVPGSLTLNDNDLMAEAALNGLGIAYVPEIYATDHIAAGSLVAVLDDWCPPFSALTLYYPGRRHVPSALRALVDLMKEPGVKSAMKRR